KKYNERHIYRIRYGGRCTMRYLLRKQSGIIGTSLFVIMLLLTLLYLNVVYDSRTTPEVEAGVLDLAGWDARNGSLLRLNGEWEYHKGLLSHGAISALEDSTIVAIP